MYEVAVTPRAVRDLKRLPKEVLYRVDRAILKLRSEPYPARVKHLRDGKLADFRIRVGDYRILFDVDETMKRVVIFRVGHRKNIYR